MQRLFGKGFTVARLGGDEFAVLVDNCSRTAEAALAAQQVLEGMRPGANPEAAEAAELLLHLNNLIANGGVIEFFNGTLVLPRAGIRPADKPAKAAAADAAAAIEETAGDAPVADASAAEDVAEIEIAAEAEPVVETVAEPAAAETPAETPAEPEAQPE